VSNGPAAEAKPGNCLPLRNIPVGLTIHALELVRARRAARAQRRTGAVLTAREGDHALVTLPSSEMRRVNADCRATVGQVGNVDATSWCSASGRSATWAAGPRCAAPR